MLALLLLLAAADAATITIPGALAHTRFEHTELLVSGGPVTRVLVSGAPMDAAYVLAGEQPHFDRVVLQVGGSKRVVPARAHFAQWGDSVAPPGGGERWWLGGVVPAGVAIEFVGADSVALGATSTVSGGGPDPPQIEIAVDHLELSGMRAVELTPSSGAPLSGFLQAVDAELHVVMDEWPYSSAILLSLLVTEADGRACVQVGGHAHYDPHGVRVGWHGGRPAAHLHSATELPLPVALGGGRRVFLVDGSRQMVRKRFSGSVRLVGASGGAFAPASGTAVPASALQPSASVVLNSLRLPRGELVPLCALGAADQLSGVGVDLRLHRATGRSAVFARDLELVVRAAATNETLLRIGGTLPVGAAPYGADRVPWIGGFGVADIKRDLVLPAPLGGTATTHGGLVLYASNVALSADSVSWWTGVVHVHGASACGAVAPASGGGGGGGGGGRAERVWLIVVSAAYWVFIFGMLFVFAIYIKGAQDGAPRQ